MKVRDLWLLSAAICTVAGALVIWGAVSKDPIGVFGQVSASWVQAVGSILAIFWPLAIAMHQRALERQKIEDQRGQSIRAALDLSHRALTQLSDRLHVASTPYSKHFRGMALREFRTSELIEAVRGFDFGQLPPAMGIEFTYFRSNIYAVNMRITDVYRGEEARDIPESRRKERIKSALRVYDEAVQTYQKLIEYAEGDFSIIGQKFKEDKDLRDNVVSAYQSLPTGNED